MSQRRNRRRNWGERARTYLSEDRGSRGAREAMRSGWQGWGTCAQERSVYRWHGGAANAPCRWLGCASRTCPRTGRGGRRASFGGSAWRGPHRRGWMATAARGRPAGMSGSCPGGEGQGEAVPGRGDALRRPVAGLTGGGGDLCGKRQGGEAASGRRRRQAERRGRQAGAGPARARKPVGRRGSPTAQTAGSGGGEPARRRTAAAGGGSRAAQE